MGYGDDYNWLGFGIAFVLLCILPIWFLTFTDSLGFFMKVGVTVIMGVVTWLAVGYGGTKRGFLSK